MPQINHEQIIAKAKEIANMIAEQEEVIIFKKAEKQIRFHRKIQDLIMKIKIKQQELVNAKHLKKMNYVRMLEEELDALNSELHSIPLVDQYQQYQAELNKYIQTLINLLVQEVSETIPLDDDNLPNQNLSNVFTFKV